MFHAHVVVIPKQSGMGATLQKAGGTDAGASAKGAPQHFM